MLYLSIETFTMRATHPNDFFVFSFIILYVLISKKIKKNKIYTVCSKFKRNSRNERGDYALMTKKEIVDFEYFSHCEMALKNNFMIK